MRNLQTTKLKFRGASGRLCTLGMCVDVTEMTRIKAAEAKRQEMEERLALQEKLLIEERQRAQQDKLITALASDCRGVYYVELDRNEGTCYQVHPELEHGFQVGQRFPNFEGIAKYGQDYVTEEYREEFRRFIEPEHIRAGLMEERVISFRYRIRRGDRESCEMIRFAGVRHPEDRDDHVVHAVSMCFMDVDTEMRRTMEQSRALSEALNAAEEANRAKTVFLSNMSHEIRTPMNAIIGLDNIALNNPGIPAETREQLQKIGGSAQHLLSIINDILDMSRIESGRMVINSEEFSFSRALEQVNTIIGGQCRDKGLAYECRITGRVDDSYIGDDMKLRQVLINILGNAVKFTPAGGRVCFEVGETARFDGKATLRFVISDTGIGMGPEYLPLLFDAFTQEDSSSTSKYGSTGLGMPITKSLVELMNGHIDVESEKGVGTTFTVTVTLRESERTAKEPEVGELDPHDMVVLVIDDDPVACEHAKVVLGQAGISCDAAVSGQEGVEMVRLRHARQEPYNLILVDWKMPEMDGLETTRQIRGVVGNETAIVILTSYNWDDVAEEARQAGVDMFAAHAPDYYDAILMDMRMPVMDGLEATRQIRAMDRDDAKRIPIIALTANAFDEDVQRSMQAGLNAHLSKPVEPEALFETLENFMREP